MHMVSETELDTVATMGASVHLGFFGMGFGALIAFGIALLTIEIPDPRTYAAFVAMFAVSVVASLYFGTRGVLDYRAARRKLREIKWGS